MKMRAPPPQEPGLPPGARARHVDRERRRTLAHALHTPASPPRELVAQLDALYEAIAAYRARAIQLHARLLELEAVGNDNLAPLRRAVLETSVRVEDCTRALLALRRDRAANRR